MRKSLIACALALISLTATPSAADSVCVLKALGNQAPLTLPNDLIPNAHPLPDGHSAMLATRSGWVLRVNLTQARITAQVRVGEAIHATDLSAPRNSLPSMLAVVTAMPNSLVLLDEWFTPIQKLKLADKTGHTVSAALGIQTAHARQSFVLVLEDLPEVWEISYNPHAPDIGLGLVHDFQYREGQFVPGYLNPKRTVLDSKPLDFALVDEGHAVLTRHTVPEQSGRNAVVVTHLDVRRQVPSMAVPPWPVAPMPAVLPWVCK